MSSHPTLSRPSRVLIVRLSSIGDTILTTPLVSAIRECYPDCEVDWVVGAKSREIVEMCRGISRIFIFPKLPSPLRAIRKPGERREFQETIQRLGDEMKERRYDYAFDVQGLLKSAVAMSISGAAVRVGWDAFSSREMSWVFSNVWRRMPRGRHVVDAWLDLLTPLGCRPAKPSFPIEPPADAMEEVAARLSAIRRSGPVLVMNIGASKANKCWAPEKYAELAQMSFHELDAVTLFTWGSEWEREVAQQAADLAGDAGLLSFQTTLFTLAALLKQADAYVGGDTGPTHLAAAVGTPAVALFGITNPIRVRPYGDHHMVISRYSGSPEGRMSTSADATAMQEIEPLEVYSELRGVLEGLASPESGRLSAVN